jgi:hypothetical protein
MYNIQCMSKSKECTVFTYRFRAHSYPPQVVICTVTVSDDLQIFNKSESLRTNKYSPLRTATPWGFQGAR